MAGQAGEPFSRGHARGTQDLAGGISGDTGGGLLTIGGTGRGADWRTVRARTRMLPAVYVHVKCKIVNRGDGHGYPTPRPPLSTHVMRKWFRRLVVRYHPGNEGAGPGGHGTRATAAPHVGASTPTVIVFPILSTLISALCAVVIARDALSRPRPDKVAWVVAFVLFAVAAASETIGSLGDWSPLLVRIYYLTGAVLVVGYLALGELYLLARPRIERFAPGVTMLVTAFAAALVFNAPVDDAKLAHDGWEALETSAALTITTITLNAGGTLVIVGGLLYSAWKFRKLGIQRNRMIGCLLIALGTLVVAMGGTATRLGEREYFYVMMSIGVALIFAGYLWIRRPDGAPLLARQQPAPAVAATPAAVTTPSAAEPTAATVSAVSPDPAVTYPDPAIAYIETRLLPLDDVEIDLLCREWSVERDNLNVLRRPEAIFAWQLRKMLTPAGQTRYDSLEVPTRRQIADLYRLVLTAEPIMEPGSVLVHA